jgi:butyrate kinase
MDKTDEWAKAAVAALLERVAKAIGSEAMLMVRRPG